MLLLSKIKFFLIVIFVIIIPSILFFVVNNYKSQAKTISVLEKSNDLTIEYFNKKNILNSNIDEKANNILNNQQLNNIEKFNLLNDCLFTCTPESYNPFVKKDKKGVLK